MDPTKYTFEVEGETITVVVMDSEEFEEIISNAESLLASRGTNVDSARAVGNIAATYGDDTAWLYERYDAPTNHLLSLCVRGLADRIALTAGFGEVAESADQKTFHVRSDSKMVSDMHLSIMTTLTVEEQRRAKALAEDFLKKIAPKNEPVADVRLVNLSTQLDKLRKQLVRNFGKKNLLDTLIEQIQLSLVRVWTLNDINCLRQNWNASDYLERLIGTTFVAYKREK